jgi:hypothetical protein
MAAGNFVHQRRVMRNKAAAAAWQTLLGSGAGAAEFGHGGFRVGWKGPRNSDSPSSQVAGFYGIDPACTANLKFGAPVYSNLEKRNGFTLQRCMIYPKTHLRPAPPPPPGTAPDLSEGLKELMQLARNNHELLKLASYSIGDRCRAKLTEWTDYRSGVVLSCETKQLNESPDSDLPRILLQAVPAKKSVEAETKKEATYTVKFDDGSRKLGIKVSCHRFFQRFYHELERKQ